MAELEGMVAEIVYRNEDNGFTVMEVACGQESITAVGSVAFLQQGEQVRLWGDWVEHPEYGRQMKVTRYEAVLPSTEEGIKRYLASGQIDGIGPATAEAIVQKFGMDTLQIMQFAPQRLMEVSGIGKVKCAQIAESFAQSQEARGVLVFLQSYGVSALFAQRIYKTYGVGAVEMIRQNPYRLVQDIEGIGFKSADRIAQSMGIEADNPFRLQAGITYILSVEAGENGHVYLPAEWAQQRAAALLQVDLALVENAFMQLVISGSIILEDVAGEQAAYLPALYTAESETAQRLWDLAQGDGRAPLMEMDRLEEELQRLEREQGFAFAPAQKEAVALCLRHRVAVITGGPGTGKTTIIRSIVTLLEGLSFEVALAAPTGRAAKRMSEATGHEASTLHRLLEYGQGGGEEGFQRNEEMPLEQDVLIVDEVSMMDISLAYRLMRALPQGSRLILVGDVDQLPSVGPGNFLRDVLQCGRIPSIRLHDIYRQDDSSMIVINAHRINEGEMPQFNAPEGGFFIERRGDMAEAVASVVALNTTRIPKHFGFDPLRQVQVLTPMRKGVAGTINLNARLQEALNPPAPGKAERRAGGQILRVGDKIMQIKNNYQLEWVRAGAGGQGIEHGEGVFNGDMGELVALDDDELLATVRFDDERVALYEYNQLDELELAYAISVHKSQGSEFPAVILPLVATTPLLMTRNLLYTAVTRARELVVIVGREWVVGNMIGNNRIVQRYSGLLPRLNRLYEELP